MQPKTLQNYTLYKTKLKDFENESNYKIDYHTINTEFFERYQYYLLTEEKGLGTKIPLNVKLPPQAIEILKHYKGKYKALPKISHQKFNEYIKECCQITGIDTPTIYKTFPKGIETENRAPKYELIGSHTARKTFITYLYHKTKNVILTAKIAGYSPDIIKKHYVGTDWEMENEAMEKAFEKHG